MTVSQIERRLAALEADVAKLKAAPNGQNRWWEQIAGSFSNDPVFDEAMRLGREWRDDEPARPRRNGKGRSSRRGKSQ